MDMLGGIASASITLSSSRVLTVVSMAMMRNVLDSAEQQGRVMKEMMETVPPNAHQLDIYA